MEDFNLGKWLAQEAAREKLVMAGYRGQAPYITFLLFRLVTPILFLAGSVLYVFVIAHIEKSFPISRSREGAHYYREWVRFVTAPTATSRRLAPSSPCRTNTPPTSWTLGIIIGGPSCSTPAPG